MNPATLRLIGTILEIMGTFLLAAEAIKVHNLRALRGRYLTGTIMQMNPIARSLKAKSEGRELPGTYFGILVLLGAILVYGLVSIRNISVSNLWISFRFFVPSSLFVDILVAVPAALVLLFILSLCGSFLVQILSLPLLLAIILLEFIEKHTVSGLIGILGFLCFLVGATLKAYLDWTGA